MGNIPLARQSRVQVRSRLAGKLFSHMNVVVLSVVKLHEAGSWLRYFPSETGKCWGNFLHINRPLRLHLLFMILKTT